MHLQTTIMLVVLTLFFIGCSSQPRIKPREELSATYIHSEYATTNFFLKAVSDYVPELDRPSIVARGMASVIGQLSDGRCVVMTNSHVIQNMHKFYLTPWTWVPPEMQKESTQVKAQLIATVEAMDLALLSFDSPVACKPANIPDLVDHGQYIDSAVYAYGQPGGYQGLMARGYIIGLLMTEPEGLERQPYYVTTMHLSSGFSGGGAFNSDDVLIGLVTGVMKDKRNLGYVKPINELLPAIKSAIDFEEVKILKTALLMENGSDAE